MRDKRLEPSGDTVRTYGSRACSGAGGRAGSGTTAGPAAGPGNIYNRCGRCGVYKCGSGEPASLSPRESVETIDVPHKYPRSLTDW